jgi:hypothetical protein
VSVPVRGDGPGPETDAWMSGTYKALRESGWDHSAWTRRRIVHILDSKAPVDIEFTRYRKDGAVIVVQADAHDRYDHDAQRAARLATVEQLHVTPSHCQACCK